MRNIKVVILMCGLTVIMAVILLIKVIFSTTGPENPSNLPIFSPSPSAEYTINTGGQSARWRPESAGDLAKDVERIKSKKPLSEGDAAIRSKLLASLGNTSGTLNESSDFKIDYFKAPNQFMVKILSVEVGKAKQAAIDWFKGSGVSSDGICNLPVVFYLGSNASEFLQKSNLQFNPVPEGC